MSRLYQVAGHCFKVSGENLCSALESLSGFEPFAVECADAQLSFVEDSANVAPEILESLYSFAYEDVTCLFGKTKSGYLLSLKPELEEGLYMWHEQGSSEVIISGHLSPMLLQYALWVGFGILLAPYETVAIHSSCVVYGDKAVIFLGESGTGKSTHTKLWLENIKHTTLLNDDSPILRVEDGRIWVYGSPWSGKTPCYKQEKYELKACVRLSQAKYNQITKLPVLQAYASVHPSCPPMFAYDETLYDHISLIIDRMISSLPFYHLACLPDIDACELSFKTIFDSRA